MREVARRSERRTDAGKHGDESRAQRDAQWPRRALERQTVAAIRKRDPSADGQDQHREAGNEENMEEVDSISRSDGRKPQGQNHKPIGNPNTPRERRTYRRQSPKPEG